MSQNFYVRMRPISVSYKDGIQPDSAAPLTTGSHMPSMSEDNAWIEGVILNRDGHEWRGALAAFRGAGVICGNPMPFTCHLFVPAKVFDKTNDCLLVQVGDHAVLVHEKEADAVLLNQSEAESIAMRDKVLVDESWTFGEIESMLSDSAHFEERGERPAACDIEAFADELSDAIAEASDNCCDNIACIFQDDNAGMRP